MKRVKSPSDLKKYAMLVLRLQRENNKKPTKKQATKKAIEEYSRDAVDRGIVNNEGHIVEVNDDFSPK